MIFKAGIYLNWIGQAAWWWLFDVDQTKRTLNSTYNNTIKGTRMSQLTANDLKVRGIAAIEEALTHQTEATISVRGTQRFVVMDMAHYHYLRECELEAALVQSRSDLAAGRVVQETAEAHMTRLEVMLTAETLKAGN
jgi:hypothetical protein